MHLSRAGAILATKHLQRPTQQPLRPKFIQLFIFFFLSNIQIIFSY